MRGKHRKQGFISILVWWESPRAHCQLAVHVPAWGPAGKRPWGYQCSRQRSLWNLSIPVKRRKGEIPPLAQSRSLSRNSENSDLQVWKNVVCFWGWSLLVSFVWHAGLWGDCSEQALFLMQTLWDRPSCLQRLLTTPASTKLLVIYCIYYTVF